VKTVTWVKTSSPLRGSFRNSHPGGLASQRRINYTI